MPNESCVLTETVDVLICTVEVKINELRGKADKDSVNPYEKHCAPVLTTPVPITN